MDLLAFIRKKSREEWQQLVLEQWTDFRIWIHEHGMQSFVIGIISGLLFALAFRLIMGIVVVGGLLVFCAWQYALPQAEHEAMRSRNNTDSDQGRPPNDQSL